MKRAYNQINHYKPNINNFLDDDTLNIILSFSKNVECFYVCKRWYDIILKCSDKCVKCHKVVKMYEMEIWANDVDDKYCHEYLGSLQDYRTLKEMIKYKPEFFKCLQKQTHALCKLAVNYDFNNFKHVNDEFKTNKMWVYYAESNCNWDKIPNEAKTELFWIKLIKRKITLFTFVDKQTEKICLEAVKNDGMLLKYVKKQTDNICMEAVKNNGYALQYVKNQTHKICIEAINQYWYSITVAIKPTKKLWMFAINKHPNAIKFMPKKYLNEKLCLDIVKNNGSALQYIDNNYQTKNVCLEAIKQNISAVKYIVDYYKIHNDILELVKTDPVKYAECCYYCIFPNNIYWSIIQHAPQNIKFIKNPTQKMCEYCIDININNFNLIENPTQKTIEYAYNKDNFYVSHLKTATIAQYIEAFKTNNKSLDAII